METPQNDMEKDILDGFKMESIQLLQELSGVVERIEATTDQFPSELMTEFSQKVDRIMGASKTISMAITAGPELQHGLDRIGKLSELCKVLGYKAAEKKTAMLLPIFAAFWTDTIEVIDSILKTLDRPDQISKITAAFSPILQKRLEWLANRIAATKGTAAPANEIMDIEALAKRLGL